MWPTHTFGDNSRGRRRFFQLAGTLTFCLIFLSSLTSCSNNEEPVPKKLIFVLLDKTDKPKDSLVYEKALHKVQDELGLGWYRKNAEKGGLGPTNGGGKVVIASFKGSVQDIKHQVSITLKENSFNETNRNRRKTMKETFRNLKEKMEEALHSPYKSAQTPLLYVLNEISEMLAQEQAQKKTLLILSNMLENSELVSFYNPRMKDEVKNNPKTFFEKKIKSIHSLPQFAGVNIYIVSPGTTNSKIDDKLAVKVKEFWHYYFAETQGTLVAYHPFLQGDLE